MDASRKIGQLGEEMAAGVLMARGYELLCRNYACPYGEIDLIVRKNKKISFVEVKTRTSLLLERPAEAVDLQKSARIRNAARSFMAKTRWVYEAVDFQVIEIFIEQTEAPEWQEG